MNAGFHKILLIMLFIISMYNKRKINRICAVKQAGALKTLAFKASKTYNKVVRHI